eukprot:5648900-Pyramimonas_sp.AAC.1
MQRQGSTEPVRQRSPRARACDLQLAANRQPNNSLCKMRACAQATCLANLTASSLSAAALAAFSARL